MAEIDDLKGPLQPGWFYNSVLQTQEPWDDRMDTAGGKLPLCLPDVKAHPSSAICAHTASSLRGVIYRHIHNVVGESSGVLKSADILEY